jgi:hypothetical protein
MASGLGREAAEAGSHVSDTEPSPTELAEDRVARSRARRAAAQNDEDVVKLPRGKGFILSKGQLLKVVLTASLLVFLLVIQRPCSEGVSKFVTSFDDPGSAAAKMPKPGTVDPSSGSAACNVMLTADMTEAEMKAAIEKACPKAGSATAGSGSAGN